MSLTTKTLIAALVASGLVALTASAQDGQETEERPDAQAAQERQESPGAQQSQPPAATQSAAPPPAGPICTAQLEGQVSCQGNRLCECVHASAVPARGLPDRWRWDCSIKRPKCTVTPESFAPHQSFGHTPTEIEVDHNDGDDDGGGSDG